MTNYVVLMQDRDDEGAFRFMDVVEADHGPEQAIRRFTDDLPVPREGSTSLYIAVPVRNWNVVPRVVSVPAPRVEIAEVDTADWMTGFLRQNRAVREETVAPREHEQEATE